MIATHARAQSAPVTALLTALGFALLGLPNPAAALRACPAPQDLTPRPAAARADSQAPVSVESREARYRRAEQLYHFSGEVELNRADQRLLAERLRYDAARNRVETDTPLQYREPGLTLWAQEGWLQLDENRGELDGVRFALDPGFAHGSAERARIRSEAEAGFDEVRYTSCPPRDEDWWLSADALEIDREEGFGSARNATLRFFGVPILYTPYISFPIDERRKSGLLPPVFGYSGEDGLDLSLPYYLNLAPNYDATVTPRLISERGLMLGLEGRLLRPAFQSLAELQYLPDDRLDPRRRDRWSAGLELGSRAPGPLYYSLDLNRVSDPDYLDDFGNSLATVSASHLPSQAVVGYRRDHWHTLLQAQTWQSLEDDLAPADRPYRVLPRLGLQYWQLPEGDGLGYSLPAELVRFDHPEPALVDTGTRLDLAPSASYRGERQAWYLASQLGLRLTGYDLERPDPTAEATPQRGVPWLSLDGGVFLERDTSLGGHRLLQTLEPRLYYLYVPYRDQDGLPLFDTETLEPTLAGLFQPNRFTGADRVGDANYFALGLTSRYVDAANGREYLRMGLGQAFYLEDREVTIGAPSARDRQGVSPLMADLRGQVGGLTAYADLLWDPYQDELGRTGLRLSYRPGEQQALNFAYRKRNASLGEELEQTELSLVWPVGERWLALAGWHYSLLDELTLERFAGFAYRSCCWTLRTVARERIDSVDAEPEASIMLQVEFTGLGALGQPLDEFLLETISGYSFRR